MVRPGEFAKLWLNKPYSTPSQAGVVHEVQAFWSPRKVARDSVHQFLANDYGSSDVAFLRDLGLGGLVA